MCKDIYQFMGADIDPTVKKIENGQPTKQIFTKDTVYKAIQAAIKDGSITNSLKIEDNSKPFINYIFGDKKSKIEVLIPNFNFNGGITNEIYSSSLAVDRKEIQSKYIEKFDGLVKLRVKVMKKNIALLLATTAVVSSMIGLYFYAEHKESEINAINNRKHIEETTEQRKDNGIGPIRYASLEQIVDDAIDESSLGGRKL